MTVIKTKRQNEFHVSVIVVLSLVLAVFICGEFGMGKRNKSQRAKCPICAKEMTKQGMIRHLLYTHKISHQEIYQLYPEFVGKNFVTQYHLLSGVEGIDFVICPICDKKLRHITADHLFYKHNMTTQEFQRQFPDTLLICKKLQQTFSDNNAMNDPDNRKKVSDGQKRSWENNYEERLAAQLETHLGKKRSPETCENIREAVNRPEIKKKQRDAILGPKNAFYGRHHTEETIRIITQKAIERCNDPEYQQQMSERWERSPNKLEICLLALLNIYFPCKFKFVGDGRRWIGGKIPDFISRRGERLIIEVFGDYWHGPKMRKMRPSIMTEEERCEFFATMGFRTLIVWEHEMSDLDKVAQKIEDFIQNKRGDKVTLWGDYKCPV